MLLQTDGWRAGAPCPQSITVTADAGQAAAEKAPDGVHGSLIRWD